MPRIKPILFNTEMVQANLNDLKSATRRLMKGYALDHLQIDTDGSVIGVYDQYEGRVRPVTDYAPCQTGDILYVRETWRPTGVLATPYAYRADEDPLVLIGENGETLSLKYRWRPSIHMPKDAARLFLRVTDVRVERLQDITPEQARAEGCDGRCNCPSSGSSGSLSCVIRDFSVEKFETVWDCTIKPADLDKYGWDANPWVWVIEYERCEKPEGM